MLAQENVVHSGITRGLSQGMQSLAEGGPPVTVGEGTRHGEVPSRGESKSAAPPQSVAQPEV